MIREACQMLSFKCEAPNTGKKWKRVFNYPGETELRRFGDGVDNQRGG